MIKHPVPEFETPEYTDWRRRLTVEKFLYFVDPHDPGVMASLRNICAKRGVYQVCRLKDHQVIAQLVRLVKDSELAVVIHPEIYGKLIEFWLVPHIRAYDHIGFLLRCGDYPHETPREVELVQPMGYPLREVNEDRPQQPSTAQTPSELFKKTPDKPAAKGLTSSTGTEQAMAAELANAEKAANAGCEECERMAAKSDT